MGLFLKQDEERSELQQKIAMELRERAKDRGKADIDFDGLEDSRYIEGMKTTTSLAWVWILIVLATVGIVIWLIYLSITTK